MQITPAVLQSMNATVERLFDVGYRSIPIQWKKKARQKPSSTFFNIYHFLAQLPEMRRWVGPRVVRNLEARAYTVRNEPWELTVGIDRRNVELNNLGEYDERMQAMGQAAASWTDKMLTEKQLANDLCWDGQNFYDTDHPVVIGGSATYQNAYTATPLTADNLAMICEVMLAFKNELGQSMGIMPTVLEVPPTLLRKAVAALKLLQVVVPVKNVAATENVAAVTTENPLKHIVGDLELVVNPRLNVSGQTDVWYVHSTNVMMPFLIQAVKEPVWQSFVNPNDPNVFWQREYVYGTDADGAADYTMPFLSIRAKEA
jgi:phage major head subunit gpT-like protein